MNGVEILNMYTNYTDLMHVIIALSALFAIVSLISLIFCSIKEEREWCVVTSITTTIMLAVLILTLFFGKEKTIYEVTISDDVSMTEFCEKYNVEDVRGKIYTVTEKEDKYGD